MLERVRAGALDIDAALGQPRHVPFEDLGFAKAGHHRALRCGMPEVILAQGKSSRISLVRYLWAENGWARAAPCPHHSEQVPVRCVVCGCVRRTGPRLECYNRSFRFPCE